MLKLDKAALRAGLLAKLEAELANMRRAAKDAREAATHEEAKPENDKDTRALEASYLAGAQAARVRELEVSIKSIEGMALLNLEGKAIQASAIVVLEEDDGSQSTFFMAPYGGGTMLEGMQVLSPQSPLGKAALGRTEGEVLELKGPRGMRELTVISVR